jgi:hypothetical protein
MKIFNIGLAIICTALLGVQPCPAFARTAGKPLPPLQIAISPVNAALTPEAIKAGDIVEFKITAQSLIDVTEMDLEIELIGGAKLVSGETSWYGPAAKNEEKSLTIAVQAPQSGNGKIRARVTLQPSAGSRFSKLAIYTLGPEPKEKTTNKNDHPVRKDKEGRDVIEYR